MFNLYIDGSWDDNIESDTFRLQVEGPAAEGCGVDIVCPSCDCEIDEDGEGHPMTDSGELDFPRCADYQSDPATWEENNRVEAWCNSASIDVRDDEVSVGISIGDPRGALSMTVRRVVDEEGKVKMYLFVPHEEDTMPHVHLKDLGGGRYEIGD